MDEWYQSPEQFHHDQDMVQWTDKLRPCAEALYIVLFENYKQVSLLLILFILDISVNDDLSLITFDLCSQILSPVVISILREAMSSSPPLETEISSAMLLKDAAYSAAGHVYYELSSYLNFSDW